MRDVRIAVHRTGENPYAFIVTVNEAGTQSRHSVTMSRDFAASLSHPPEEVIVATFRFLLDREPKESILSRFDITAITQYFPEFSRELPSYLAPI